VCTKDDSYKVIGLDDIINRGYGRYDDFNILVININPKCPSIINTKFNVIFILYFFKTIL